MATSSTSLAAKRPRRDAASNSKDSLFDEPHNIPQDQENHQHLGRRSSFGDGSARAMGSSMTTVKREPKHGDHLHDVPDHRGTKGWNSMSKLLSG